MTKHFLRDMEHLQHEILAQSALVEEMIDVAARSLYQRDPEMAAQVIKTDRQVDDREVHIEDFCLKILALHQPVAVDLRRVTTVLKVNGDLERIADLAVNIAKRAEALARFPAFHIPDALEQMVTRTTEMVRSALDAFVNLDAENARAVCIRDDEVDELNDDIIGQLYQRMLDDPSQIQPALNCFSATRHVERIADHATNIAEDVIFLVEGEIVRHSHTAHDAPVVPHDLS